MKNLLDPAKKICVNRDFRELRRRTFPKQPKCVDMTGFCGSGGGENSPERAVIMAKSLQFEGVSLWSR
jgi:hypothetical protein